ncbi:MAG: hypothetical protein ACR2GQ_09485 [Gemmatimonadota bacterium]
MMHDDNMSDDEGRVYVQPEGRATHELRREATGFRLSWGAIFGGLVIAVTLQIVLGLLGLAIGLDAWDPGDLGNGLGAGAGIWSVLSLLLSLFVGGLTTGRLAGVLDSKDGALHGVLMWGLTVIATVWLIVGGMTTLLGGTMSVLGETVASTAGAAVGAAGQMGSSVLSSVDIDYDALEEQVARTLDQSGVAALRPDSLRAAAEELADTLRASPSNVQNRDIARNVRMEIEQAAGQIDGDAVFEIVAARTDLSETEARRLARRIEGVAGSVQRQVGAELDTLRREVSATATEVSQDVANAAATGAWWALLGLMLSMLAAAGGAAVTARS